MIYRVLAALLTAVLGWVGLPMAGPAAPADALPVQIYSYGASHHAEPLAYTATERGPPAMYDNHTIDGAGDRWSRGASARPDAPMPRAAYDYDRSAQLAPLAHGEYVTEETAPVAVALHALLDRGRVAAKTGDDFVGPLSKAEYDGLQKSLEPNKLNHLFAKQEHGLDGLVSRYGSQEAVVEQMYRGLSGAVTPGSDGLFSVTRRIGGQAVTIDGRVVNGIPRIGTAYIKP